ncbi:MAG TPA: hypothetical protein VGR71_04435 [Nitrospira sp.]|nr:hypothetical protein [Nitrospira sp.]
MTTTWLGTAQLKLASGKPTAIGEVDAELQKLSAERPWTNWGYSDIKELYMRLDDISRTPAAHTLPNAHLVDDLKVAVSGEAWKIANPASPHHKDAESERRRAE